MFISASLRTASEIFNISDKAVHGLGAYSINNGTVEIAVKLVIDVPTSTLKDKTTATISMESPSGMSRSFYRLFTLAVKSPH